MTDLSRFLFSAVFIIIVFGVFVIIEIVIIPIVEIFRVGKSVYARSFVFLLAALILFASAAIAATADSRGVDRPFIIAFVPNIGYFSVYTTG